MRRLSTRIGIALCAFVLAGCGGVPLLPGDAGDDQTTSDMRGPDITSAPGRVASGRDPFAVPPTPVPPLKSGTQALFDRAVELQSAGKYEAAQVLLLEITAEQPELAGPWVNLGLIHAHAGDVVTAADAFATALQANPKNCDALTQMGVLKRREGDFEGAEAMYRRCLDANPGYAHAYLNLGILYELYMGRYGEALAAYNDYQIIVPEPDQRVTGWVMDLERRVAALANR